jgi:hypothetical protein
MQNYLSKEAKLETATRPRTGRRRGPAPGQCQAQEWLTRKTRGRVSAGGLACSGPQRRPIDPHWAKRCEPSRATRVVRWYESAYDIDDTHYPYGTLCG